LLQREQNEGSLAPRSSARRAAVIPLSTTRGRVSARLVGLPLLTSSALGPVATRGVPSPPTYGTAGLQRRALPTSGPRGVGRAVEQRDAADEGRLEPYGSIIVGNEVIVNQGKVVRPSQLIASVRWACGEECGERRFGHGARSPSRPLGVPSPGSRRDRPGVVAQQQVGSSPRLASPSGTAAHLAS